MKRSKHSLSHYKLVTLDMGKLIPVGCYEVLPGDTVQQATSVLLRVSPLVAPVMHPVSVRLHHWFVPHRLVWTGWEDFITGGPDGLGGGSGAYPTTTAPSGTGFAEGELMDYLGVPPGVPDVAVSSLPHRSYNRIYNEYYRDEDLCPVIPDSDRAIKQIAWEKDYFTSARPWPQKGPDVTLPLGSVAPVTQGVVSASGPLRLQNAAGTFSTDVIRGGTGIGAALNAEDAGGAAGDQLRYNAGLAINAQTADLSSATAINVNDMRRMFAIQRYQEARAMYGSRYTEYLRYLGVRSSDARLQRPEYLGGGKATIAFSEVLQTGPNVESGDSTGGIADLKGHGISAMRSRRFRRFFEEHGIVMTLMSVRPRTMYVNGVERMWNRRIKEDYWQKELEFIGQQEVFKREVFAETSLTNVFGYQDRFAEYRHIQSGVSGEFRSTLNYWHLARIFASSPTLNQSFVECVPSKRIHAEQTKHVLWCMVMHNIQARRMVAKASTGRII